MAARVAAMTMVQSKIFRALDTIVR